MKRKGRRHSDKPRSRGQKKGRAYEEVVAEVVGSFDPHAKVTRGAWERGPDGRRELDVRIEGTAGGRLVRTMIECKDYDPASSGPIGIELVDALESKRRDLALDSALICSNAGYTADAVRKAARVGLGLVSVMKKDDSRVRFAVQTEIYVRQVKLLTLTGQLIDVDGQVTPRETSDAIKFEGASVIAWVTRHLTQLITMNPIVNGVLTSDVTFTHPVPFTVGSKEVPISSIIINAECEGAWFAHEVELDATAAFYDWISKRIRQPPSPGQFEIRGLDVYAGGQWIERPPDWIINERPLGKGDVVTTIVLFAGFGVDVEGAALERFITYKDAPSIVKDLPAALTYSKRDFARITPLP